MSIVTSTTLFATRAKSVEFLVAEGKPQNLAKVAIDQGYNYDHSEDHQDCLRRMTPDGFEAINGFANNDLYGKLDAIAVLATKEDILAMYDTFFDMLEETAFGIAVDGEVMYDVCGNPLPNYGYTPE